MGLHQDNRPLETQALGLQAKAEDHAALSERLPAANSPRAIPHGSIVTVTSSSHSAPPKDSARHDRPGLAGQLTLGLYEKIFGHISTAPGVQLRPRISGGYEISLNKISGSAGVLESLRSHERDEGLLRRLIADGHCLTGHTPSSPALRYFRMALKTIFPQEAELAESLRAWEKSSRESPFHYRNMVMDISVRPFEPNMLHRLAYKLMQVRHEYPPSGTWYEIKIQAAGPRQAAPLSTRLQGLARQGFIFGAGLAGALPALNNTAALMLSYAGSEIPRFSNLVALGMPVASSAALMLFLAGASYVTKRGDTTARRR